MAVTYDPFIEGEFPVGVRSLDERDEERGRVFPCEVWYPATAAERDASPQPGRFPLILYSHHSGGNRRAATFLCTHLSSHGYIVAALDHSEVVAPELARKNGESATDTATRIAGIVRNRVPDLRFLLDRVLANPAIAADPVAIGLVGHSLGGWAVLSAPDTEPRIRAVVANAPGGNSRPKPGIIRSPLTFAWKHEVPTLFLVGDEDVPLPLDGMFEIFERAPSPKRMFILHGADHLHFIDNVEELHEAVRGMPLAGEAAWIPKAMRPIAELCSGEHAHLFLRGLTLAHFDASLKRREDAQRFLAGDVIGELRGRGVNAAEHG
jgi:predicted dienelactone hydrolase